MSEAELHILKQRMHQGRLSKARRGELSAAPLLGILFGLGWTPCIGPTLSAVQVLAFQEGTAGLAGDDEAQDIFDSDLPSPIALIVGSGVSAQWKDWILFTNRVDFGRKDATFHTDPDGKDGKGRDCPRSD